MVILRNGGKRVKETIKGKGREPMRSASHGAESCDMKSCREVLMAQNLLKWLEVVQSRADSTTGMGSC